MTAEHNSANELEDIRQGILNAIDWLIDEKETSVAEKRQLLDVLRRVESLVETYIDECGD